MSHAGILVCTVGGSASPILTAVRARAWDHVVFVCTSESKTMVTGQVPEQSRNSGAAVAPPPIPEQTGLAAGYWSMLIVPPDDLDQIYALLTERLDQLREAKREKQITVDYTGGTKSMSAAAVLAVTLRTGIKLQLTSGQRSDLVRVVDGTQQATGLATDRVAIDRQVELLRAVWRQYGYQEAADGFEKLVAAAANQPGVSVDLRDKLKFWHRLGRAFAAWDRFDRKQAAGDDLQHPSRRGTSELRQFVELALMLQDSNKTGVTTSLVLFDLLRNAERCVARGRHDDAVARCYRLWEWTVQWLLQADAGIDTGNVERDSVPPEIIEGLVPKKDGRFEIGSSRAWKLYRHRCPSSGAARFWEEVDAKGKSNDQNYAELGPIRNKSILAHGAQPIGEKGSRQILGWTAGPFMDMLRAEALRLNQPDDMPQLPGELPEFVVSTSRNPTSL